MAPRRPQFNRSRRPAPTPPAARSALPSPRPGGRRRSGRDCRRPACTMPSGMACSATSARIASPSRVARTLSGTRSRLAKGSSTRESRPGEDIGGDGEARRDQRFVETVGHADMDGYSGSGLTEGSQIPAASDRAPLRGAGQAAGRVIRPVRIRRTSRRDLSPSAASASLPRGASGRCR